MKRLATGLVAYSLLAGCSGGGGTSVPASQPTSNAPATPSVPVTQKRAAAAFKIVIPKATAASKKRPLYISPATQSLVVALTAVNGTPIPSPQSYAVNLGGSGCPVTAGQPTCTLVVPATAGSDVFSIVTYDAVQSSTTPATLIGNRLSMQTTTVAIAAGTANVVSVPVSLDGVVASLGVTLGAPAYFWHPAQTIPISIAPRDAAGDLIVAPGGYRDTNGNPLTITLSDSDQSGSTSLSATSLSTASAAASAALTYTGGQLIGGTAVVTASAPGFASVPMTLTPSIKSGTLFVGSASGTRIYDRSGSISSATLLETVGSGVAHGVALGSNGTLYQSNESLGTVDVYLPGGATPTTTLTGLSSPEGIALDPTTGRIYVAQMTAGPAYFTNGSTTVSGTAAAPSGGYIENFGAAVNSAGSLYTLDAAGGGLIYFYPSGLGQAAFLQISGVHSESLSFESNGDLLFAGYETLFTYDITSGNLMSVAHGLPLDIYGVTQDAAGNVFVSLGDSLTEVPNGATTSTLLVNNPGAGLFQIAVAP
jgi:hypothetical protein